MHRDASSGVRATQCSVTDLPDRPTEGIPWATVEPTAQAAATRDPSATIPLRTAEPTTMHRAHTSSTPRRHDARPWSPPRARTHARIVTRARARTHSHTRTHRTTRKTSSAATPKNKKADARGELNGCVAPTRGTKWVRLPGHSVCTPFGANVSDTKP
jgi:hypothetical protein